LGSRCASEGEEWKELFLAADQFRLLAPWEWMDDSQVFGVRDPWTGEAGWCVVIGAAGLALGWPCTGVSAGCVLLPGYGGAGGRG